MAGEEQNLGFAKKLWEELMKIEIKMEERLEHLFRILHLAVLLRLAPVKYAHPRDGVCDVLCSATTDVATVTGANSRLRSDCAKGVAGGSRVEFNSNPKLLESRLGFKVGAFDAGDTSRLCKEMAEAGVTPVKRPIPERDYQNCAEHVVFEKLDRISGQRARFTYALQKTGGGKKQRPIQVQIVERCKNCKAAGGEAKNDGEPFGMTARLGRVVTDHPRLIGLDVPVITPRVLQYFRSVVSAYYDYNFDTNFDDVPPSLEDFENPLVRVWPDTSMQRNGSVRALGPTHATSINKELSAAGLPESLLDA